MSTWRDIVMQLVFLIMAYATNNIKEHYIFIVVNTLSRLINYLLALSLLCSAAVYVFIYVNKYSR